MQFPEYPYHATWKGAESTMQHRRSLTRFFFIPFCLFAMLSVHSAFAAPVLPDTAARSPYDSLLNTINARRTALAEAYGRAGNSSAKDSILKEARRMFVSSVAELLAPQWFGTPWDFYGTTEMPGKGKIACGYFVSTLLRHAALKVERVRMAQQASERIVKSLAREKEIKRFSNIPIDSFVAAVKGWGEGLYVVGLDYHVGFLYHNGREVRFIHSSYIDRKCVVSEPAPGSAILASSKYRVVGKISANDDLLRKWLLGTTVKTAG